MDDFAKLLILLGIGIVITGVVLLFLGRVPGLNDLPGTFVYQGANVTCVVPILLSILLSVILTVVLNVVVRFLNK